MTDREIRKVIRRLPASERAKARRDMMVHGEFFIDLVKGKVVDPSEIARDAMKGKKK